MGPWDKMFVGKSALAHEALKGKILIGLILVPFFNCYAARSSGHIFLAAVAVFSLGHGPTVESLTHTRSRCVSTQQLIFARVVFSLLDYLLETNPLNRARGFGRVRKKYKKTIYK